MTLEDRYYTPEDVAAEVAAIVRHEAATTVLDSNCGPGRLLDAAATVFPRARFMGIDLDRRALAVLSRLRPSWRLVYGDALTPSPWVVLQNTSTDVAVLNPPFSMIAGRGSQAEYEGATVRVSTSMAHVLAVLDRAKPNRVAAILPESWAFSDLDSAARAMISRRYLVEIVRKIKNSTFRGARANCLLVSFSRRLRVRNPRENVGELCELPHGMQLVRGGLPLFQADFTNEGTPYLHTTDIVPLTLHGTLPGRRVRPIGRGLVRGHTILLPRVGVPSKDACCPVFLPRWTQLSDCVLAISTPDRDTANRVCDLVHVDWAALLSCYSGTGARFTTETRLRQYLSGM